MYHPTKWRKLSPGIWEVDSATVGYTKIGWTCDECVGEVFRIGGRKQWPCKHVRWVIRREKILEELRNENKIRR